MSLYQKFVASVIVSNQAENMASGCSASVCKAASTHGECRIVLMQPLMIRRAKYTTTQDKLSPEVTQQTNQLTLIRRENISRGDAFAHSRRNSICCQTAACRSVCTGMLAAVINVDLQRLADGSMCPQIDFWSHTEPNRHLTV